MLRATNRALRQGCPNCFYVISTVTGLTAADQARLSEREGNDHVSTPVAYADLMRAAGFVDVEVLDVTPAYVDTLRLLKETWEDLATPLIDLLGEEDYMVRLRNRTLDLAYTEEALVVRQRIFGVKR